MLHTVRVLNCFFLTTILLTFKYEAYVKLKPLHFINMQNNDKVEALDGFNRSIGSHCLTLNTVITFSLLIIRLCFSPKSGRFKVLIITYFIA